MRLLLESGGGLLLEDGSNFLLEASGPTYHFATAGNDSTGDGSLSTPWASISKANSELVAGATLLFNGGDTFSGSLYVPYDDVTLGSYGSGQATLSATGNNIGIYVYNVGGFSADNLILTGPGGSTAGYGVFAYNDKSDDTVYYDFSLTNLAISAYGKQGILFIGGNGGAGRGGFDNILIDTCTIDSCTFQGLPALYIGGKYGSAQAGNPTFTNIRILDSTVSNCPGKNARGPANDAIVLSDCADVLVEGCVSHDNGANVDDPVSAAGGSGFQSWDSTRLTFRNCESYNNTFYEFGNGIGFTLGGGNIDCVIEHCYAHDNGGPGIHIVSYTDGYVTHSSNDVVRYNLCVNNGTHAGARSQAYQGTGLIVETNAPFTCFVYGNTFVNDQPWSGHSALVGQYVTSNTNTGYVFNNLFVATAGGWMHRDDEALGGSFSASGLLFQGNDWWDAAGTSSGWLVNTVTYSTYGAWRSGTGQETVSATDVGIHADPSFAGGGGTAAYKLTHGSPAIGTGRDPTASPYSQTLPATDFFTASIGSPQNMGCDGATT